MHPSNSQLSSDSMAATFHREMHYCCVQIPMVPWPEFISGPKLKLQKRNIPSTEGNSRISACLMSGTFSMDWGPEFKGAIISACRGHREASGIVKKMSFGAIAERPAKICAMMPRNPRHPLFCAAARVQCPKISARICVAQKRNSGPKAAVPGGNRS